MEAMARAGGLRHAGPARKGREWTAMKQARRREKEEENDEKRAKLHKNIEKIA